MKKCIFATIILTMLSVWSAVGEDIKVPILWKNTSVSAKSPVEAMGFLETQDKCVWAIKIRDFSRRPPTEPLTIAIYSDIDDNRQTGRFPGQTGWDMQINIQIHLRKLQVFQWKGNDAVPLGIPLYSDDYRIDVSGDVIYIGIRREPLKNFAFCQTPSMRLLPYDIDQRLNRKMESGYFTPHWQFHNWGNEAGGYTGAPEAVEILRRDKIIVWNSFGERYRDDAPVPKMSGAAKSLRFSAAKGESEAVHFAVSAEKPLRSLEIQIGTLRNGSAVIPENLVNVHYVGWVSNVREESYPDILRPVFRPQKSKNNFVAVEVNVPRDAVPGIYRGEAAITVDGKPAATIPLELEVFNFSLPDRPFFKTAYCMKSGYIPNHFANASAAELSAEYNAITKLAKHYRLSPRLLGRFNIQTWENNELRIDWNEFDKACGEYFGKNRFTVLQDTNFQLGSHGKFYSARFKKIFGKEISIKDPVFTKYFTSLAAQTEQHYRDLGLLDRMLFVIWDEPYDSVYPDILTALKAAKAAAPDMKFGIFIEHPSAKLAPYIDVWLSNYETLANMRFSSGKDRDKRVWCYNNIGIDHFKYPASVPRLYYFLAMKYRIEGYLYSEINAYRKPFQGKTPGAVYNSWINYNWFYPGDKPGKTMGSLRMLLTREGLDDYDYLELYRRKHPGGKFPPEIEAAFPVLHKNGEITFTIPNNRRLSDIRYKLGKELSK